jgi:hypothetical protein
LTIKWRLSVSKENGENPDPVSTGIKKGKKDIKPMVI